MSSISQNGLVALTWAFTGVDVALTIGRFVIRKRVLKRFDWDDLTHGLAVCMLLGYVSTYTASFPRDYQVEFWAASKAEGRPGAPPSQGTLDLYVRSIIAVTLQFWVCIYLIKLSFLLFYRRLFGVSRPFMRAWWVVLVFTALTFLANFLATLWSCDTPDQLFVVVAQAKTAQFVKMWCALNVASDLSIMILPLWMLRTLQMRTAQKLGLAALFLLGIIDVAFDVMRTVYTVDGGAFALDTLWDILEPVIAVLVSCLPTYYSLVRRTAPGGKKKKQSTSYRPFAYSFNKDGSGAYVSGGQHPLPSMATSQQTDGIWTQVSVETSTHERQFV